MKETNKEVMIREGSPVVSVENLIKQAITSNSTVDVMERLLAMRRELKAEAAKEQFDTAMAEFQNECPIIKKAKAGGKTNSGVTGYYYAPLDTIVQQTKALIMKHGFSYSIQTETRTKDKEVVARCIARHKAGHSESSDMTVPLGGKTGIMSDTQVVAAAITFAKRYAFCNAFGILTGDPDTDGPVIQTDPRAQFDNAIKLLNASKTAKDLEAVWKFKIKASDRSDDEVLALKNSLKKKLS